MSPGVRWRRFLHRLEPVGGPGALHRPAGGASSHTNISGGVLRPVVQVSRDIRRTVYLGLKANAPAGDRVEDESRFQRSEWD